MQRLAYIGKITELSPIPGADLIVAATVVCGQGGKWLGVVRKDDFGVGDSAQVFLQDALLPPLPRYAFLEKSKYRIRMRRLKGVPSECLIMPMADLAGNVGDDVTDILQVTKYEKPIPACISGETLGDFPGFIPHTDEPNFQGVPELVDALRGKPYYTTVKMDGTSTTAYKHQGHFGVCSRNWEKKENDTNAFWQIAKRYNIAEWLPEGVALQWETIGPGIQKNPAGLKQVEPRLFDVYFIGIPRYGSLEELVSIAKLGNFPMVPILESGGSFNMSDEELRVYAEGLYGNGHEREGVVVRPTTYTRVAFKREVDEQIKLMNERLSFKVINLKYKD